MNTPIQTLLAAVKADNFRAPADIDVGATLEEILPLLGSPDPELRDTLAYATLAHWIMDGVLSDTQVRHVAARLVTQDYLFYRIESDDLQAVLLRSFSALALAPVVLRHRERAFLSPAELSAVTDAVASYAGREHIFTGYHPEYGWVHAAAHTADLIDELLLCTEAGPAELARLMEAVLQLVTRPAVPFIQAEDERLAFAACSAATRPELGLEFWEGWLSSLAARHRPDFTRIQTLYPAQNIRNFLKSFLVYARARKTPQEVQDLICRALADMMKLHAP